MVTASVALTLDSRGTFVAEDASSLTNRPTIPVQHAAALAEAFSREFGPYRRDHFELLRGAPIDFSKLVAVPRVLISETPYGELPTEATDLDQMNLGSYYLVDLRVPRGAVVLRVAVSVHSTSLRLTPKGLRKDAAAGNAFRTWVVPVGERGEPGFGPEEAIEKAYSAFGRPVAERPRFIRAGALFVPQIGRWRVRFDAPVAVVPADGGAPEQSDVVYVTRQGSFEIPSASVIPERTRYRTAAPAAAAKDFTLQLRLGLATSFRAVTAR